jgi:hypothetical protein
MSVLFGFIFNDCLDWAAPLLLIFIHSSDLFHCVEFGNTFTNFTGQAARSKSSHNGNARRRSHAKYPYAGYPFLHQLSR